jgi:hypothetical protein
MVGQVPLKHFVQVRILVAQPDLSRRPGSERQVSPRDRVKLNPGNGGIRVLFRGNKTRTNSEYVAQEVGWISPPSNTAEMK